MNRSTFCEIKVYEWTVLSKARYMIGVGFKILARTPVPKLPQSYPHEGNPYRGILAISEDLDGMPQRAAFHKDLYCLL